MIKTISVNGYEFKVDFDYYDDEKPTIHSPGGNEYVEVTNVWDSDGDRVKVWALALMEEDVEIACLNEVYIDQEEAKMAKEEARQEAWETRNKLKFEQWE